MYIKRPKHNIMAFYIQEVTFFMLDGFRYCLLISLFVQKQRYAHFWIDWEWDAVLIIEVGGNALAITLNDKHVLSPCKIYFFFATGWKKTKNQKATNIFLYITFYFAIQGVFIIFMNARVDKTGSKYSCLYWKSNIHHDICT